MKTTEPGLDSRPSEASEHTSSLAANMRDLFSHGIEFLDVSRQPDFTDLVSVDGDAVSQGLDHRTGINFRSSRKQGGDQIMKRIMRTFGMQGGFLQFGQSAENCFRHYTVTRCGNAPIVAEFRQCNPLLLCTSGRLRSGTGSVEGNDRPRYWRDQPKAWAA